VLFVVDDLGWRDLACYGSPLYETPAIDRLAAEGMRFTRAYAAHPRCVPSRAALMTGKFPARLRCPGPWEGMLPPSETTMAEMLRDRGYATFFVGKWHLGGEGGLPTDQGFDEAVAAGKAGAPRSYFWPYNEARDRWAEKHAIHGLDDGSPGEYLTDRLTAEAIGLLERHVENEPDRPFLLVLCHYAVHTPLQAKDAETESAERRRRTLPESSRPEMLMRDGETKTRQDNAVYAAMVRSMDRSLASIDSALDRLELGPSTVVIVTSDHGGLSNRGVGNKRPLATSNAPLRAGKGHVYEGGLRIPLIVRWPGVTPPESTSNRVCVNTDIAPTLLEIAGGAPAPDAELDGVSLVNTLAGDPPPGGVRPIFFHSPRARPRSTGDENASAVLLGDWKLIDYYDQDRAELFNIAWDPGETLDLSASNPERARRLLGLVRAWRDRIDAHIAER
jgi:arylsulfatase A-like enzyme